MAINQPDLLVKLREGDRKAQHAFYQRFAGRMLVVAKRYLGPVHAAEDVLVESMMTAFNKIDQYDGSGPIEAWLRRIVVNHALQQLRRQNMMFVEWSEDEQAQAVTDPGPPPDQHFNAADLMGLIARLPDGYRTVFNLYAIEGFSHQEIAQQLNIAVGTSKSQLNRARQLLQDWATSLDATKQISS